MCAYVNRKKENEEYLRLNYRWCIMHNSFAQEENHHSRNT